MFADDRNLFLLIDFLVDKCIVIWKNVTCNNIVFLNVFFNMAALDLLFTM